MVAAMNAAALSLPPSPDGALGRSEAIRPRQPLGDPVRHVDPVRGPDAHTVEPAIELANVTKRFVSRAGSYTALLDLNLQIADGEFCTIVGPTGSGKSTTLSLISGLEPVSAGTVRVLGSVVNGIPPNVGFMFQTDAIYPWKSVLDNVVVGLRFRGVSKREARDRARDWVARVGLAGFEAYYPHQLSGGMRKRVALAQTLITEPRVLLMDEPFSALDAQTRVLMEDELLGLWAASGATVVFVTHDLEEAIALADRVIVLTAGPATVKGSYVIDLPRPREVAEIRFQPRFAEILREIWQDVRSEVLIGYERSKQRPVDGLGH
jgi:NitT/TauT family transport system ATP-binding protein